MRYLAVSGGGIEYRSRGVGQGRLGEDGPLYKARDKHYRMRTYSSVQAQDRKY